MPIIRNNNNKNNTTYNKLYKMLLYWILSITCTEYMLLCEDSNWKQSFKMLLKASNNCIMKSHTV